MRITVIGLGAVGGTLAALADRAGHEVVAIARGATAEAISRDGLRLSGAFGEHTAHLSVAQEVPQDAELVVIAVRTFQTLAALREHADSIGDTPVLIVQNGLDGPSQAERVLGRSTGILGGMALFAATNAAPGVVNVTGRGAMRVGALSPGDAALRDEVVEALAELLPVSATSNLAGALWMKLLVNHVNALPAITALSVQQVSRHPLLVPPLAESLEESVSVADALGVRFESVGVLSPAHERMIRRGDAEAVVRGRLGHAFGTRPNPASTLQSIRRGVPTEITALNGAVVCAGERLGIPTPINALLVVLVSEVSASQRFLSPARVAREAATVRGARR